MQDLTISMVQTKLHWENVAANLDMFTTKLATLESTDLVILPEMFTTGFSMNAAALAETMDGGTIQWMAAQAAALEAVVTGSIIIKTDGYFYNRLIWMPPNGQLKYYDKRHTFTMAKEHLTYQAGKNKLIVEWKGWKICPLICYDLRFPAWSRNQEAYDLLFYVANWPVTRSSHWKALLQARAIENQAYTIGVNVCGKDGNGYYYTGDSTFLSPSGEIYFQAADVETISTRTLSKSYLRQIRAKLPFLGDRDSFSFV